MANFWSKSLTGDTAIEAMSSGNTAIAGFHGDPRLNETTVGSESIRAAIFGASENGAGVLGYARDADMPAVYAFGGLLAIALSKEFAATFRGNVSVEGDIRLSGADCAEQFDFLDGKVAEPGSVVVLHDGGVLTESTEPYDKRVVGVVAGAGNYRPGIILDRQGDDRARQSVSLIGKAFCKVDGSAGPISVGDLLTSSSMPGHAMKAIDPHQAFGAILGKALLPWENRGLGMIPVLVALG